MAAACFNKENHTITWGNSLEYSSADIHLSNLVKGLHEKGVSLDRLTIDQNGNGKYVSGLILKVPEGGFDEPTLRAIEESVALLDRAITKNRSLVTDGPIRFPNSHGMQRQ